MVSAGNVDLGCFSLWRFEFQVDFHYFRSALFLYGFRGTRSGYLYFIYLGDLHPENTSFCDRLKASASPILLHWLERAHGLVCSCHNPAFPHSGTMCFSVPLGHLAATLLQYTPTWVTDGLSAWSPFLLLPLEFYCQHFEGGTGAHRSYPQLP